MFTLVAFQERRTGLTSAELNAVADPTHFTSSDDLRVGKYNRIIGACVLGSTPQDAYLISPSLRALSRVYIAPLVQTHGLTKSPPKPCERRFDDRSRNPIPLETGESLNAFYTKSEDHNTIDDLIGVWLSDGAVSPVFGDIRTIHASATKTFPQLAWTSKELTITPDLPAGRYAVVGMRAWIHEGGGLVRFVFRDEPQRPGVIAISDKMSIVEDYEFRRGYLGVYGTFDTNAPPLIEVLPTVTDDSCYMRIDILKVG